MTQQGLRTKVTLAFTKYRIRKASCNSSDEMAQPNTPAIEQNMSRKILDRLQRAEEYNKTQFATLNMESKKRAEEIEQLSRTLQFRMLTETGSSRHSRDTVHSEIESDGEETKTSRDKCDKPAVRQERPETKKEPNDLLRAHEAIELVETLREREDIGVEDFIKNVRFARSQYHQKALLLKLILVKRITENAKRSIRFLEIENYEDLYNALRQNIVIPSTVSNCRDRLRNIREGSTENVQSYNLRFRQQLNELVYPLQNKHSKPVSRRIAISEEMENAVKTYTFNLRDDIGHYVIPNQPDTLLKAQNLASEIEMHIRQRRSRKMGTQKTVTTRPPVRRSNSPTTTTATLGADRDFNQLERRPQNEPPSSVLNVKR